MMDDQGIRDFGCTGNHYIKTPELDVGAETPFTFGNVKQHVDFCINDALS